MQDMEFTVENKKLLHAPVPVTVRELLRLLFRSLATSLTRDIRQRKRLLQ